MKHIIFHLFYLMVAIMLPLSVWAGATNLPAFSTRSIGVDSNLQIVAPVGVLASNAVSLVNPAVRVGDVMFTNWATADGFTWTNTTGWISTAEVTNGLCNLSSNSLVSPVFSGVGFRALTPTWSNLTMTAVYEASTNLADWFSLETLSDCTDAWPSYMIRISATNMVPSVTATTNNALLQSVQIYGHQFPGRIGVSTSDFSGIQVLVDDPVSPRAAVNLQTLDSRIAAIEVNISSPSNWAARPALQPVNLNGQTLSFDPRYTASVSNDTWSLAFSGQPVFEIVGGGTVTPQIVYFSMAGGTQVTLRVIGSEGWRPYPQWSPDLAMTNWIQYGTNEFASTYPSAVYGQYTLSFTAVTNTLSYYRVVAIAESTNVLHSVFRVPVQFDHPISGPGLGDLVRTQDVSWLRKYDPDGFEIGRDAKIDAGSGSLAFGSMSRCSNSVLSIALGEESLAVGQQQIAIGLKAHCGTSAAITPSVQLGKGTNTIDGSLQFREFQLLNSEGHIPAARINGWSGGWTNIMDNVTNVLNFDNGVATNRVTL